MANVFIGPKLRHQRKAMQMTLEDVATKVGCSESMVSKIETGRVNPTLNLLHKIASALDINLATLFSEGDSSVVVSRSSDRPRFAASGERRGGGIMLEPLVPHSPEGLLQANMQILQPGGTTGDPISHFGHEMGFVLKGTIELEIEGKVYTLRENDSFHFWSDRLHTYRNPGTDTAQMIVVNTPPSF